MVIPVDDVPEIAQRNLQRLVKSALPDGRFVFGGQYSSPSPHANRKRQRTHVSDIIVRSSGQWSDSSCLQHGDDIVSLLAHLQKVGRGVVVGQLGQWLQPMDKHNDTIVP
jgi:hypothetical protein